MEQLDNNLISLQDYAEQKGISYEAVRSQIARYSDDKTLMDHIHKIGRTRFLDEDAVEFLDKRRNSSPVVVVSGEKNHKIEELELKIKELTEDRDRQRDEKEAYLKKIVELQEKGIDTSKYIAIEDHHKTELELEKKLQEIEELKTEQNELQEEKREAEDEVIKLKEENGKLLKSQAELQDVTIRNSKLVNELNEKMNLLDAAKDEKTELEKRLITTEAEKDKIAEEIKRAEESRIRAEEDKKRAEQEAIEFLQLGFFARRKKLKELKNKNE